MLDASMSDSRVPDYYLRRPSAWPESVVPDFEGLFADQVAPGTGGSIQYQLAAPKWQFLCWLTESKEVVLHGGNSSTVHTVEPRPANDISEFGARNAVYAASDGIWPMYFAIANRAVVTSLVNSCVHLDTGTDGARHHYFFSVSREPTRAPPWVEGTVHVLPRDTFEPEPAETWHGHRCIPTQWVSPLQVRPMASLAVTPADFPFLHQVRSHDRAIVAERAARDPDGFPWLSEADVDPTSDTPPPERP
jgi:hypothetical protein